MKPLSAQRLEARRNRTCQTCHERFTPKNSRGIYCSTRCRVRAHRAALPPGPDPYTALYERTLAADEAFLLAVRAQDAADLNESLPVETR